MVDMTNWIPLDDVFSAYYECRRNKRNTSNALKFELDYEHELVKLWKDINLRRYEIGRSICFMVTRPKLREVFAADFRDRIVHHIIMQRLEPLFEDLLIDSTYSCRKGKGTLFGVLDLERQIVERTENWTKPCYVGKFDMQGFFMTIHKPTLLKKLIDFVEAKYIGPDKETLIYLIEMVVLNQPQNNCIKQTPDVYWERLPKNKSLFTCGEEYGLPIGNLTSQCFANFYLDGFDKYVSAIFGNYGRYVDDFFVLGNNGTEISKQIKPMSKYLCENLRVRLHRDKVYIQDVRNGVKFIGGVVKPHRRYVSNRTVHNAFEAVKMFNTNIGNVKPENVMQTMNSYFGFIKHYKSHRIKKRLIDSFTYNRSSTLIFNTKRGIFNVKKRAVQNI